MSNIILESLSTPFAKALPSNSYAFQFTPTQAQTTEPTGDGIFDMGWGGQSCPRQVVVYPYAMAQPGINFKFRLYCWRVLGADPKSWIWIRALLKEATVTTGPQTGFANTPVGPQERFCGTAAITYLTISTAGCQKIQFEFAQVEEFYETGMNALWARA